MTAEREKAINEWLGIHCRMCANNDDRGTDFLNCQAECEDFNLTGDKRIESLDTAISYLEDYQKLLNKYEKIKEILDDDTYYENYGNHAEGFIVSAIIEVIKDEDNN